METVRHDDILGSISQEAGTYKGSLNGLLPQFYFLQSQHAFPTRPYFLTQPGTNPPTLMSAPQRLVAGSTLYLPLLQLSGPASPPLAPPMSLVQQPTPTPAKFGSTGPLDLSPFSFALPIALLSSPLHSTCLVRTTHSSAPPPTSPQQCPPPLPFSLVPAKTDSRAPCPAGVRSSPGDHGPDEVQQQQAEGAQVLGGHGFSVPASVPAFAPHTPHNLRLRSVGSPAHPALRGRRTPRSPTWSGATASLPPPLPVRFPGVPSPGEISLPGESQSLLGTSHAAGVLQPINAVHFTSEAARVAS